MEGKRIKVFGVVMALLLVFSFASTFTVSSTVSAASGLQKWKQVQIPGTDDMQLAPGTDIGAIAVSPEEGETIFAAVYNASGYTNGSYMWSLWKSIDDGYTWTIAGDLFSKFQEPAVIDNTQIVAIRFSPDWQNDKKVYVATQDNVYSSKDGGKSWAVKNVSVDTNGAAIGSISCMDVSLDDYGDVTVAIGTSSALPDVYILGEGGWEVQRIELAFVANTPSNVLAVAFSPNYGEDGCVFAVVETDNAITWFCGESDITVNNWGSYIQNAMFTNKLYAPLSFPCTHASIAFAEDYNSTPCAFVGLKSGDFWLGTNLGDAYRVDLVSGIMSTSAVTDLDIRGKDTECNVWSIAVAGPATSAFILVGLTELNPLGPSSDWMGQIHYSQNGGETWLQSYKPAGGQLGFYCSPVVVMAPSFNVDDENSKAYCGNGFISPYSTPNVGLQFSGFFVSTTKGTSWNGRGLLDHSIDAALGDKISDIQPSPEYESDSTLFMVTRDANYTSGDFGLLWETRDGGTHWELINGMTLAMPLPGMSIERVAIPATYPQDPEIFVTGAKTAGTLGPQTANALVQRSTDEGNLFASALNAPWKDGVPLVITSWVVMDDKTLVVANGSDIYKTTDFGAHWKLPTKADINTAAGETVIDLVRYKDTGTLLAGTDRGNMYLCPDWQNDFSFNKISQTPCIPTDITHVSFDTNFDENGFVYAGITSTDPANRGIWRADVNSDELWDRIDHTFVGPSSSTTANNISALRCDGNGILWALDAGHNVSRSVNPATADYEDVRFEEVAGNEFGLTSVLRTDLETAPTHTFVFAIGGNSTYPTELWAYIDTLIKPTLISPADGATAAGTILQDTSNALVTFLWEDMPKAKGYELQVAYDSAFGSLVDLDPTDGTLPIFTPATQATASLILGQEYYWRVRSNESVLSQWSDTWSFTTPLGPASAKPVITYPGAQDSHNDIELTPSLTWTSTVQATGFELVLAANCDWSHPIVNLTGANALVGTDTCYAVTTPLAEGTNYCWKVRAVNEDTDTMSPWSDTGTFTTLVTPVEEDEGTPIWVWVVIALSAVLLIGVVVLIIRTRRPV